MNSVNLIGRIARDPELKLTKDNLAILSTSIAIPKKDSAIFMNIKAFGKTAENMNKFFAKGMQIGISGHLDVEEWQDKEGKKRTNTVIIVNEFSFADKKKETQEPQQELAKHRNELLPEHEITGEIPTVMGGTGFYTLSEDDEDLPF